MKTIFEQQTLAGFAFDSSWGAYTNGEVSPPQFVFEDGKQYQVYFDGETYVCTAISFVLAGVMSIIAIGNGAYVGQSGNNEPFLITYNQTLDNSEIFTIKTDASHTIAIYEESTEEPETPEEPSGNGFILKNYHGEDVLHEGIEKIVFVGAGGNDVVFSAGDAIENVPIELDFSGGDQKVIAPEGTLVKSAVIEKPETLTAENIADGVNVAGILGTHKGGGGGSEMESTLNQEHWLDDVCFWDLDGNLLKNIPMSEIQSITEADFPSAPQYENLIFQCWNHSVEDIRTTKYPLDVAPIYSTSDGKTHIKLQPYDNSSKDFKFNFSQTVANGVIFDWGDGSAAQTVGGTGLVSISHTYSSVQEYELTITVSEGCSLTLGGGTSSTVFIAGSALSGSVNHWYAVKKVLISENVELNSYAFYYCKENLFLSLPKTLKAIPSYSFYYHEKLHCASVPRGVEKVDGSAFCYFSNSIQHGVAGVISLPQTIKVFGSSVFYNAGYTKRIAVPKLVETIPMSALRNLYKLKRCFLPDDVKEIKTNFLQNAKLIEQVELPEKLITVDNYFLANTFSLKKVKIPRCVEKIGDYAFNDTGAEEIVIPASVGEIGSSFCKQTSTAMPPVRKIIFEDASGLSIYGYLPDVAEIVILGETPPTETVLNRIVTSSNYYIECFVPDSALEAYKALLSNYKHRIKPLSEYNGTFAV